jgi:hypothetical protein
MKKSKIYETYIEKWRNRLGGTSILQNKAVLNRIALPYEELERRMAEISSREDLTATQRAELLNQATAKKEDVLANAYEQSQLNTIQQRNQIEQNIMSLEEQRDIAKQQEKEQKKLEDKTRIGNIVKAGATVLGGVIGSIVPGVGTVAGASIGSGIGNIVVGMDKTYHQPEAVLSGVQDLASAYSEWHTSKRVKDISGILAKNMDNITNFSDSELSLLKYYLEQNDLKGIETLLGGAE